MVNSVHRSHPWRPSRARPLTMPKLAARQPLAQGGSEESDEVLVDAIRRGRAESKRTVVERYATHVRRVLVRVLGPDPEMADLVQDVFVVAFASIEKLTDPSALRAWLTRI